ncbi:hypothetical protein LSM04_007399 [Trypanosoma melophagium]|uniref:uncharacterized protein n=1 Tax=Trypanosoma melophagium TaxID=715481 RepID=UPI00351A7E58|nr:hypothetical protein LSM04_007399 [Trypanosoma melophagium]
MLATVSPAAYNLTESISTLEYAQNAMAITNKAKVNKLARHMEYDELQKLSWLLQVRLDDETRSIAALDAQRNAVLEEIDSMKNVLTVSGSSKIEEELRGALEERENLLRLLRNALEAQNKKSGSPAPLVCFSGTCKTSLANIPFGSYEVTTLPLPCYNLAGPPPLLVCRIHLYLTAEKNVAVLVRLQELQHLPDYVTGGVQVTMWFDGNASSSLDVLYFRVEGIMSENTYIYQHKNESTVVEVLS